jgi:hypothetical protein
MDETIGKAIDAGIDFIIFSGMTLKEGRQKDYFYNVLNKTYPEFIAEYNNIYRGDKWGGPIESYYESIHRTFNAVSRKYKIPKRIPPSLYQDILSENDRIVVILEHIDYLLKSQGKTSPYGFSAYFISKLQEPLSNMKDELQKLKGVGKATEGIILEILETGSSSYYEKLLTG